MGARIAHAAGNPGRSRRSAVRRRVATLLTVAIASTAVVTAAAVASASSATSRGATTLSSSGTAAAHSRTSTSTSTASRAVAAGPTGRRPGLAAKSAGAPVPAGPPVLTARDVLMCPPPATACADLTRKLTWLQSGGSVTFGPVRMEPGPPGSAHATPRGTFHVSWKAGPAYISTIYGDPMPWAVFFAPGGIAFHGGSLTIPSHGCVHLTVANAHYYNEHLPVGAEVVVF
jgi:lipoprotein-anchoring transpeptidase ErfK/SrfK